MHVSEFVNFRMKQRKSFPFEEYTAFFIVEKEFNSKKSVDESCERLDV